MTEEMTEDSYVIPETMSIFTEARRLTPVLTDLLEKPEIPGTSGGMKAYILSSMEYVRRSIDITEIPIRILSDIQFDADCKVLGIIDHYNPSMGEEWDKFPVSYVVNKMLRYLNWPHAIHIDLTIVAVGMVCRLERVRRLQQHPEARLARHINDMSFAARLGVLGPKLASVKEDDEAGRALTKSVNMLKGAIKGDEHLLEETLFEVIWEIPNYDVELRFLELAETRGLIPYLQEAVQNKRYDRWREEHPQLAKAWRKALREQRPADVEERSNLMEKVRQQRRGKELSLDQTRMNGYGETCTLSHAIADTQESGIEDVDRRLTLDALKGKANLTERQRIVVDLRLEGKDYRDIALALAQRFKKPCSEGNVRKLYHDATQRLSKAAKE